MMRLSFKIRNKMQLMKKVMINLVASLSLKLNTKIRIQLIRNEHMNMKIKRSKSN